MDEYQKRGYLLENFRLFHLHTPQKAQIESHYHEFCKLLFLISGSGNYMVEGQRYLLQPGDIILIGSHCVHRPELEADVPYERIILYVSPDFLRQQSTADCDLQGTLFAHPSHVLRLKEKSAKQLFSKALQLEQILMGEEYGKHILSHAILLQLLVELSKNRNRPDVQKPEALVPQNPRILEIIRYIHDHLFEDMDINALADEFYISKYHMMRLFHQETGFTVYTYLTQRRLLAARQMIDNGMRATEACYRCGFHSYSSFTRSYSKHFGTTPTGRRDNSLQRTELYE